ncbi:1871_t:CDS:2 [Funneliformis caledonium]|uniref:1871_t:CDS:1 n=1 Tax=Funneliformis caledonium TaxID=1117310 RepID=A0A9N9DHB2_9GLOM|nr:1871_t:CDS:2 [Funneliformis caledonium]
MSVQSIGGEVMSCLTANNFRVCSSQLAATVDPLTLLKLTHVCSSQLAETPSFMSVQSIGGEVMSCLTANNFRVCSSQLAATVDPLTLLKLTHVCSSQLAVSASLDIFT